MPAHLDSCTIKPPMPHRNRTNGATWRASYRLSPGEPTAAAMARIVAHQIASARESLSDPAQSSEEAVHEARKALKRARSALRLVREPLGPRYGELDDRWRDLARRLAPQREADAALATLERLEGVGGDGRTAALGSARRRVSALRRETPDARFEVARALEVPVDLAAYLPEDGWELVAAGLRRSYARGRAAMEAVKRSATPAACHRWRKRAKDLWHYTEILVPACPELLEPAARSFHDLAEILGDLHDLDELERLLAPGGDGRAVGRAPALLHRSIAKLRAQDLENALELGARLYAERPKPFMRRIGAYWTAWRPRRAAAPDSPPLAVPGRSTA